MTSGPQVQVGPLHRSGGRDFYLEFFVGSSVVTMFLISVVLQNFLTIWPSTSPPHLSLRSSLILLLTHRFWQVREQDQFFHLRGPGLDSSLLFITYFHVPSSSPTTSLSRYPTSSMSSLFVTVPTIFSPGQYHWSYRSKGLSSSLRMTSKYRPSR